VRPYFSRRQVRYEALRKSSFYSRRPWRGKLMVSQEARRAFLKANGWT